MPQLKKSARFVFSQKTIDDNQNWVEQKQKDAMAHARSGHKWGETRALVIEALDKEPGMTRREIAKALGVSESLLSGMSKYAERGFIRKRQQDGRLRWYPANYHFSDDPKPDYTGQTFSDQTAQEKPERNAEVVAMRKEGQTLQSIALKFGITRERVRQILAVYESKDPVVGGTIPLELTQEPDQEADGDTPEDDAIQAKADAQVFAFVLEQRMKNYAWDYAVTDLDSLKKFLEYVKETS